MKSFSNETLNVYFIEERFHISFSHAHTHTHTTPHHTTPHHTTQHTHTFLFVKELLRYCKYFTTSITISMIHYSEFHVKFLC